MGLGNESEDFYALHTFALRDLYDFLDVIERQREVIAGAGSMEHCLELYATTVNHQETGA